MYKIAVLPGDGTGPEVVQEGLKVLDAVAEKTGFKYEKVMYDLGGERYKKTGEILPESVLDELKTVDAIYLGAIGHPDVKPGILEISFLVICIANEFGNFGHPSGNSLLQQPGSIADDLIVFFLFIQDLKDIVGYDGFEIRIGFQPPKTIQSGLKIFTRVCNVSVIIIGRPGVIALNVF